MDHLPQLREKAFRVEREDLRPQKIRKMYIYMNKWFFEQM